MQFPKHIISAPNILCVSPFPIRDVSYGDACAFPICAPNATILDDVVNAADIIRKELTTCTLDVNSLCSLKRVRVAFLGHGLSAHFAPPNS